MTEQKKQQESHPTQWTVVTSLTGSERVRHYNREEIADAVALAVNAVRPGAAYVLPPKGGVP
jgi:hypothetical protein